MTNLPAKRFMDVNGLLETEVITTRQTLAVYGERSARIEQIINLLFKISYFIKEDNIPPESDAGYFQLISSSAYHRLPYSLQSIHENWLKGFYIEAICTLRHILEGFAKIRYFYNHPEQVKTHGLATRQRDRISFKTMFEECATGSYEELYGKLLSDIAHSGFSAIMFRRDTTDKANPRVIIGCEFDQSFAGFVIDQTIGYSYGYLNYADRFFPSMLTKMAGNPYTSMDSQIPNEITSFLAEYKSRLMSAPKSPEQMDLLRNIILPFIEK